MTNNQNTWHSNWNPPGSQKNNSDKNNQGKPLDPTGDAQDFNGDTYGMTGTTVDESQNSSANANNIPSKNDPITGMSDARYKNTNNQNDLGDSKTAGKSAGKSEKSIKSDISSTQHYWRTIIIRRYVGSDFR